MDARELTHAEDTAWNATVAEWRRTGQRLPWTQIPHADLSDFLRATTIPLDTVANIVDVGSCDGARTMQACIAIPELNRPDVHLHCVDVCAASIEAGRQRWASRFSSRGAATTASNGRILPQFAMSFDVGNATTLARLIDRERTDILIDWMMLHALPKAAWELYRQQIREIAPRYLLIKCFAAGASGGDSLPQTVPGVTKHQLSDGDLIKFVGREYRLIGSPMTWNECLRPDAHVDGIEAAKRAFCFERTKA